MKRTLLYSTLFLSLASEANTSRCDVHLKTVEKLNRSQQNLPIPGSENLTVKDIQAKYDQAAAKLILLEGIKNLKDNYAEAQREILSPDFAVKDQLFTTKIQAIGRAKGNLQRLVALHQISENFLKDNNLTEVSPALLEEKGLTFGQYVEEVCATNNNESPFCNSVKGFGLPFGENEFQEMLNGYHQAFWVSTEGRTADQRKEIISQISETLEDDSYKGLESDYLGESKEEFDAIKLAEDKILAAIEISTTNLAQSQEQLKTADKDYAASRNDILQLLYTDQERAKEIVKGSIEKRDTALHDILMEYRKGLGDRMIEQRLASAASFDDSFFKKTKSISDSLIKANDRLRNQFGDEKVDQILNETGLSSCLDNGSNIDLYACASNAPSNIDDIYNKAKSEFAQINEQKRNALSVSSNYNYAGLELLKKDIIVRNPECFEEQIIKYENNCKDTTRTSGIDDFIKGTGDVVSRLDSMYKSFSPSEFDSLTIIAKSCIENTTSRARERGLQVLTDPEVKSLCESKVKEYERIKQAHQESQRLEQVQREMSDYYFYRDPASGESRKVKKFSYAIYGLGSLAKQGMRLVPMALNYNNSKTYYDAMANMAITNKQYYHNMMNNNYAWQGYGISSPLLMPGTNNFYWGNNMFYRPSGSIGTGSTGLTNPVDFSW